MTTPYLTATLLADAALGSGHIAVAQTATPPMAAESKLDSQDRAFLENAARAGHREVEGSKLALKAP